MSPADNPKRSELRQRLIELSTIVSGLAQLLKDSNLDGDQTQIVGEIITGCEELAEVCRALQN